MGGSAAGEVASRLAVDTIGACLNGGGDEATTDVASPFTPGPSGSARRSRRQTSRSSTTLADDEEHEGMGTTVVGAWADEGVVSLAHVGDSRAYLATAAGFESVTSDHSLVEAQVQAGLIDREQSLKSEHQNVLLRALGPRPRRRGRSRGGDRRRRRSPAALQRWPDPHGAGRSNWRAPSSAFAAIHRARAIT